MPLPPYAADYAAIERVIGRDPGGRNIGALVQPGHLAAAAGALAGAGHALIVSGFYVPEAQAGETDGPPGAQTIGAALTALGVRVSYVTDAPNRPLFAGLGLAPLHTYAPGLIARLRPTHLIAVERVGRAADGRYYNMRGTDITGHTAPLDELFLEARRAGLSTIGIGDGGNEIGMGRVADQVRARVAAGSRIACVVETDHLIVAGVSNWGAYGLVGALSLLHGADLLPTAEAARDQVLRLVAGGGVDGVTLRAEPTVDGLPLDDSLAVLEQVRRRARAAAPAGRRSSASP